DVEERNDVELAGLFVGSELLRRREATDARALRSRELLGTRLLRLLREGGVGRSGHRLLERSGETWVRSPRTLTAKRDHGNQYVSPRSDRSAPNSRTRESSPGRRIT